MKAAFVVLVFVVFWGVVGAVVYFKDVDASLVHAKRCISEYMADNLKDPDSFDPISWDVLDRSDDANVSKIRVRYRARNGFGALDIYEQTFVTPYINSCFVAFRTPQG